MCREKAVGCGRRGGGWVGWWTGAARRRPQEDMSHVGKNQDYRRLKSRSHGQGQSWKPRGLGWDSL